MNTSALIMMISAMTIVSSMTIYYFIKVLRTPVKNPKEDSFEDTN
ncbi:MAG: hypothetical protein Q8K70_10795 [Bacteroidota bacterium]|nr:hypothetical protein [Bacteroidota bacterium]